MQYTEHLNSILQEAGRQAGRLASQSVEAEHLVLALLMHPDCEGYKMLVRAGADVEALRTYLDGRASSVPASSNPPFSRGTERVLRLTAMEAENAGAAQAGTLHMVLAVLRERVNKPAAWLETNYSVTYEAIEALLPNAPKVDTAAQDEQEFPEIEEDGDDFFTSLANSMMPRKRAKEKSAKGTPALDKYGTDLVQAARDGKLDPIIGREEEIKRVQEILCRHKKNNPILIGEPGVGKSAIVEGLAQQYACNPRNQARIISLNLSSLVAGTSYRGQFEQRMQDVINELKTHPEVTLFIDEIHTLMGAGNAQGGLDAANILKPVLARGEVRCIGATTLAEYRKTIEKDGAMERRFQKVLVRPNTAQETLTILRQLAPEYEKFHVLPYTDEALQACVTLTERYITDRAFPDKAIDVLDEVGANRHAHWGDAYRRAITANDVAAIVSRMSGVPLTKIKSTESERLRNLNARLRAKVIGQDDAIDKLCKAICRSRLGLRDPQRPIGSFFFLGSTGVGKTYLAQCLAEELFGSRDALIRFDMTEYMEKHSVSLLVGAPPGYVAHEEGGKLTEAVRRRPYSIVLFDEIEKAHPDVFNVLLQLLDEGRMTDRQGSQVDFRNTIIIMTSNVGTRQLREFGAGVGFGTGELTQERSEQVLKKALEHTFPPEFVNRIDDIVTFAPLSEQTLARILDLEIETLCKRLRAAGHTLHVTEATKANVLAKAYDPKNGARPIKRAVQTYLEDVITERLLAKPEIKTLKI